MAAALSYYTVFSLPPLLVLLLIILGAVVDPQDIRGSSRRRCGDAMGPRGAEQIRTILRERRPPRRGRRACRPCSA